MSVLAASNDIGQLVILAVVFIGWVVKEVFEAQKRKRMRSPQPQRQGPKPTKPASTPRTTREKQDVVFGTRPLPHLPGGDKQTRPARTPAPAPAPTSGRSSQSIQRSPHEARVVRAGEAGGRAVTVLAQTADTTFITASQALQRRRRAMNRLHVADIPGSLRDKTRVAILWSEVLGPCRALRGPHQAPTFQRRRAGQAR